MEELFQINIDRLNSGEVEKIKVNADPSFLKVDDGAYQFPNTINISGQSYVANDILILNFDIKLTYFSFCKICNEKIESPLELENLYITEEITNIKTKKYNFIESLRSAILLELPMFNECNGNCPKRAELKKYIKGDTSNGCTT